jgi:hypothetical protein
LPCRIYRDSRADIAGHKMSEPEEKPELNIADLPPKQAAYVLLRENGLSTEKAAKALDYQKSSAYQLNTKLNKYGLTNKKMVKSASQVVKNVLAGQPWGSVDKIKDSTALTAAQMVFDRVEPAVKQSMNMNVNMDISPVDLSKYRNNNK